MAIYYGDGSNSNAGRIIQVVTGHKSSRSSTTSTSFTSTGLEKNITPTASDSKILVLCNIRLGFASGNLGYAALWRGSYQIFQGDSYGSAVRCSFSADGTGGQHDAFVPTMTFLDEPATTSQITYAVRYRGHNGNTVRGNAVGSDRSNGTDGVFGSSIVLMEVAV